MEKTITKTRIENSSTGKKVIVRSELMLQGKDYRISGDKVIVPVAKAFPGKAFVFQNYIRGTKAGTAIQSEARRRAIQAEKNAAKVQRPSYTIQIGNETYRVQSKQAYERNIDNGMLAERMLTSICYAKGMRLDESLIKNN